LIQFLISQKPLTISRKAFKARQLKRHLLLGDEKNIIKKIVDLNEMQGKIFVIYFVQFVGWEIDSIHALQFKKFQNLEEDAGNTVRF
jgi:hypothetical protein